MNLLANLTLFAPLALAAVALGLALWTGSTMLEAASSLVVEVSGLAKRAEDLRQGVAKLPPILIASPPAESEAIESEAPSNPPPPPAPPLSPEAAALKALKDKVSSSMDTFKAALQTCASSARLSVAELADGTWPPSELAGRLKLAQSERDVVEVIHQLGRLSVEIVRVVLSKCDHDIDPERTNQQLQTAIDTLVILPKLKLYVPGTGDPVDSKRHISVGVVEHPSEDLRGTVASVRARGLIRVAGSEEELIAPAEIREYD